MRKLTLGAAAAVAFFAAGSGQAALVVDGVCKDDISSPVVVTCAGYQDGNVLSNSPDDLTKQAAGLAAIGFNGAFVFNNLEKLTPLNGATVIDFATPLSGITYIAVHFGNGGETGNSTGFYKLDAGAFTDKITLKAGASSAAVLYATTAVPEPATWAMMLGGFGLLGTAMRRRTKTTVSFA
jgi:hypothetical protein